jgi:hypothetical protein
VRDTKQKERDVRLTQYFGKKKKVLGDPGADSRMTFRDLGERGYETVDWFHPTEDATQWRALVNTIMNSCFY